MGTRQNIKRRSAMKFLELEEMTEEESRINAEIKDIIWDKFLGFMGNEDEDSVAMREIEATVGTYDGRFTFASLCHLFYLRPVIVNGAGNIVCNTNEMIFNPEPIK